MSYRDKVLPVYLEETREHIEAISNLLVDMERAPGNDELIGEIFRRAHTIKGGAASVGFSTIGEVAHRFENVLDDVRCSRVPLSKEVFATLFETADVLKQLLDAAVNGVQAEDIQLLADKLKNVQRASEAAVLKLRCKIQLHDACEMKAARFIVVLRALQRNGEILSTEPEEPLLLQGEFESDFVVNILSARQPEQIHQILVKIPDVEEVTIEELQEPESVVVEQAKSNIEKTETKSKKMFVRVEVQKLENMINLIGELVIERNRLASLITEIGSKNEEGQILHNISNQLGRITGELQMEIMNSRMVPIAQVFGNLPRLVRDTANNLGKQINLNIEGEDTELDRTLVDRLRDPMLHLIRNAIDHGIESPKIRLDAGKAEAGEITIRARHLDNNVVIDVIDDGKGINFYSVLKKVAEKGLKTAEELQGADEEELMNLVFLPGFSTADSISDISGRGVGLDVVRNEIEQMNGTVSIESKQGLGTRFTIRLPLTLAIIKALLFTVSGREFSLPLANIVETLSANQYRTELIHGSSVIKLRDKIIPLVDMAGMLNLQPNPQGKKYILVITQGEGLLGLQVDSLIEKKDIVIKPLGSFFADNKELAGVTLLGNGAIVPILEAAGIFKLSGHPHGDKNFNS